MWVLALTMTACLVSASEVLKMAGSCIRSCVFIAFDIELDGVQRTRQSVGPHPFDRASPSIFFAVQAPITEDSVYAKFSGLQTKLLALEAADFFTDLAQGVAAHFGTTGSKATAIPAQIAANFAANSAASMLLTSLNESLSILIPKGDRSVTVETSNKRRLQGWDEGLPQQTAYDDFGQGLTIVYVDSLDDYV